MSDEGVGLPRSTIQKLVKDEIPQGYRMSKNFLDPILHCAVETVQFIAGQANQICMNANKETLMPDHVLQALRDLEMTEFLTVAEASMAEVSQSNKEAKESRKRKKAEHQDKRSQAEIIQAQRAMILAARNRFLGTEPHSDQGTPQT